ncbi:hypothetical protein [Breznakia pachnodae]|uniref:Hydrolase (HD superfamily) n=1 Tax=Breznakia pachnodae TaxID=265178 RepID=A0ABU0E8K1_9FIRM|nr:hypothetical protein [Breznakia pachnodae]MDQ0363222.1 putative hydrolase (HD superfamily) [Breznakia pachnodae]
MYQITPYLGTTFQTVKGDGHITAAAVIRGEKYVQIKTNKEVVWIKFKKEPFDMNICKNHVKELRLNKFDIERYKKWW